MGSRARGSRRSAHHDRPRLGDIGMFDFHRADEAIKIGAAAERSLDQIEQAFKVLA